MSGIKHLFAGGPGSQTHQSDSLAATGGVGQPGDAHSPTP